MELAGKVALITGGARGQGRSHALRLAAEGADVVLCDVVDQLPTVQYEMAQPADLEETVKLVEATDRRCLGLVADVRDTGAMQQVVDTTLAEFGRLDIVLANAGIMTFTEHTWDITDEQWEETLGVNLTGVFKTCRAAIPAIIAGGRGGSIVFTSSVAGLRAYPTLTDYSVAKTGLVALMKNLALELGRHGIRVNTVHPTGVESAMSYTPFMASWLAEHPDLAQWMTANVLPTGAIQPADVSDAISWLVSDRAKWVTGASIPVDAGFLLK